MEYNDKENTNAENGLKYKENSKCVKNEIQTKILDESPEDDLTVKLIKGINLDLNNLTDHIDKTFSNPIFKGSFTSRTLKKEKLIENELENPEEITLGKGEKLPLFIEEKKSLPQIIKTKERVINKRNDLFTKVPKPITYATESMEKPQSESIKNFHKSTSNYDYYRELQNKKPKIPIDKRYNTNEQMMEERFMRNYSIGQLIKPNNLQRPIRKYI